MSACEADHLRTPPRSELVKTERNMKSLLFWELLYAKLKIVGEECQNLHFIGKGHKNRAKNTKSFCPPA